jgi:MFS family permease
LLGEQINTVALSWLALQVTGDPLAFGSVLAVAALPPALLMLVSGVVTDRTSPRATLLAAESLRFLLAGAAVAVTLIGNVNLAALYALALGFGATSALAMPAAGSIVPTLVPRDSLQAANSLSLSLAQAAAFLGPAIGGTVISVSASAIDAAPGSNTAAITPAFVLYGAGLAISLTTLRMIGPPATVAAA